MAGSTCGRRGGRRMHDEHGFTRSSGCLGREVLSAYHLGKLPVNTLQSVADHIATCPSCEAALLQFWGEDDTLVRNLRCYVAAEGPAGVSAVAPAHEVLTVVLSGRPVGRP